MGDASKLFACSVCSFSSPYTRFGRSLGAEESAKIVFMEDCYLLPDPNAVRMHPLCLGSHCALCGCMVCAGDACSLFYAKRFCARCARDNAAAFPPQCMKLAPKIFGPPAAVPGPAPTGPS